MFVLMKDLNRSEIIVFFFSFCWNILLYKISPLFFLCGLATKQKKKRIIHPTLVPTSMSISVKYCSFFIQPYVHFG